MNVKNIISKSIDNLKEQLTALLSTGFEPSLAIVFSHSTLDNVAIGAMLKAQNIDFIGCSTAGEIVGGVVYNESISISFFELDRSNYVVFKQEVSEDNSYDAGFQLAKMAKEKFKNPSFISLFALINGDEFIKGLQDTLQETPCIYGGMASDDILSKPYVFTENQKQFNGIHTLVVNNDKIAVHGCAIAGWESIGLEHTITKSKDNVVYEINHEPAMTFFTKFFGLYTSPSSQNNEANTINAQYPLQIIRDDVMILRSPWVGSPETNTLTLTGSVYEGEKFKFSIAPGFEVIDKTIEEFRKFKEKIPTPDALILFSCKARHWAFGPMIAEEVEAIDKLWNIPYQGFFCFGEIGKNENERTHFYNQTCCLVTLKSLES